MLTLDQKIRKWSRAVNRNKTFTPIEMEEMEAHLLVEIKQMVQYDKLTEEEAFNKATQTLGEQGILDEEYGKIRWSAFFKVKIWAYLQTFIILGLVLFLAVPYIHFPEKNSTDFIVGKEIGKISEWAFEGSKKSSNEFVTVNNGTYFYNYEQNIFYSYEYAPNNPWYSTIYLREAQFNPTATFSNIHSFDIDSSKDFYFPGIFDNQVAIYRDSKKIRSISLPENLYFNNFSIVKVINKLLLVSLIVPDQSNKKLQNKDYSSILLTLDLDLKKYKWEEVKLKGSILAMDRSEDELAILYKSGELEIYTIQNKKLKLLDSQTINDFQTFLAKHLEKPKESFMSQVLTKMNDWKNSMVSIFKPKSNRFWKLGWMDMVDFEVNSRKNVGDIQKEDPKPSFIGKFMEKIKHWKIFKKTEKHATMIALKLYPVHPNLPKWFPSEFNPRYYSDQTFPINNIQQGLGYWGEFYLDVNPDGTKSDESQKWFMIIDDAGQVWFYPDGRFNDPRYYKNNPSDQLNSVYQISLLFSKKNHQMVLLENKNSKRFSYLLPNGKINRIVPLDDEDIAGVIKVKVNFNDPERLVVIKKDSTNPSSDKLNLYLFKE